ncbi:MAG: ABC transporter substrate-binding protein, partial [Pseudomonadota bacterium]
MTFKTKLMGAVAATAMLAGAQGAVAAGHGGEITVAYFLEWPMPFQFAKETGMYEEAMGTKINWVSFDTGTAMSAAMASGDVQISVSQGVPPFVVAASAGQDIQIVDVAVSYSENDNCVVSSGLEIDKESADELAGKKVAVPLGTAAHYGFLSQMNHFGVDLASLDVVDMAPAEGAAALAQGAVDMACGWGGALRRMKESGNVLLTGAEKEELGILVFDATTAPANFIAEEGELLSQFL